MEERFYWLGFSVFSGIGPIKFKLLLDYFKSAKKAWEASEKELLESGIGQATSTKFVEFKKTFSIEEYLEKLQKRGVSFLTLSDEKYPTLLKQIDKPPFVLCIKSSVDFDYSNNRTIAIVGTRKITQYGREVTELLTHELVSFGFTIVSGLAVGVDSVAHKTCLEQSGKTIAVLGSGVDVCTPFANTPLYNSILAHGGAIVSDVPLGQQPNKGSFPARNRIISGFSQAVLVTEGAEDSGALITADFAFKFKRAVFAVPGPITSGLSKGPFKLIQKGAKLVTSVQDIVEELGFKIYDLSRLNRDLRFKKEKLKGDSEEEQTILDLLANEPVHFDELVRRIKMNSAQVGSLLSLMEIKGLVKSLEAGVFAVVQ